MIFIFALLLIGSILLIYIISVWNNNKELDNEELEEYNQELTDNINAKMIQLESLKQEHENISMNNNVNLSNVVNEILNIYEESNIKIPVDILEELSYINLYTDKEIFDYIETQRQHWKLENTKKPYKKVK